MRGLSPVAASRGHSSSRCAGLYRGLSCCGAQAPDTQAQQLWLMGPVAPQHVGSSQTRARTPVLCISRQILNHCATREAPLIVFLNVQHSINYRHNVVLQISRTNLSCITLILHLLNSKSLFPLSHSLKTTILLSASECDYFQYISGIMQYLSFCDCPQGSFMLLHIARFLFF